MRKNRFHIKFSGFILLFIGIIISILVTAKVYHFINPFNNNKIFSYNMLIAIKNYEVSYIDVLKDKAIIRVIQIILLILLLLSKHGNKVYSLTCFVAGCLCGFYGTIFYLEMGYKGIINLLIVSFPHMLFYIAAFLCLVSIILLKQNETIAISNSNSIFNKIAPYMNIILLWCIGLLSEIVINLFLVQKCFLI